MGSVAFRTNDIQNNQYQTMVGDSWTASIQGAAANQPVWFNYSFNGGSTQTVNVGTTDANGNFSYTGGTFGAGDVGSWYHDWEVGPMYGFEDQGGYGFTVTGNGTTTQSQSTANQTTSTNTSSTPGNSVITTTNQTGTLNTTNGTTTTTAAPTTTSDLVVGGVDLSQTVLGVPLWMLGVVGVGLVWLMMPSSGHHRSF